MQKLSYGCDFRITSQSRSHSGLVRIGIYVHRFSPVGNCLHGVTDTDALIDRLDGEV